MSLGYKLSLKNKVKILITVSCFSATSFLFSDIQSISPVTEIVNTASQNCFSPHKIKYINLGEFRTA